jgi:hypothetical protein
MFPWDVWKELFQVLTLKYKEQQNTPSLNNECCTIYQTRVMLRNINSATLQIVKASQTTRKYVQVLRTHLGENALAGCLRQD